MADDLKKTKKPTRRGRRSNEGTVEEEDNSKDVKKPKGTIRTKINIFKPETIDQCKAFMKWASTLGVEGLSLLFQKELAMAVPPTKPCPAFEANMDKNRYQDVFCLEETRVKLMKDSPEETDYIHANYIKFKSHDRTYIATQAPMDNTVVDFWRMAVQEKTPVIVNLTLCCEEGKAKSAQYWPTNEGEFRKYGRFMVTVKKKDSEDRGRLTIYALEILPDGCSEAHFIRLIHSTAWPDGGAADSAKHVLRVIKTIYTADTLAKGAIVIHCSAGIGRTGTMVLIDYTLYRLFTLGKPHCLQESFLQLREQRASSVQKEAQFVHISVCVALYVSLALKDASLTAMTEELEKNFKTKYSK